MQNSQLTLTSTDSQQTIRRADAASKTMNVQVTHGLFLAGSWMSEKLSCTMNPAISVGLSAKLCTQAHIMIETLPAGLPDTHICTVSKQPEGAMLLIKTYLLLAPVVAALAKAALRAAVVGRRKLQEHGPRPVQAHVSGVGLLPFRLDGLAEQGMR